MKKCGYNPSAAASVVNCSREVTVQILPGQASNMSTMHICTHVGCIVLRLVTTVQYIGIVDVKVWVPARGGDAALLDKYTIGSKQVRAL